MVEDPLILCCILVDVRERWLIEAVEESFSCSLLWWDDQSEER